MLHTGITGTTHTFFGRPYTVYPTEHHHPHPKILLSSLYNSKHAKHNHTTLYIGGTTHVNNTVAKSLNQMAPPARTITVALDMSKYFDTINIHKLIRKLLQINIPGIIMKFITNYIKERKAYTTYRNHTSIQSKFKIGVPQDGLLTHTI